MKLSDYNPSEEFIKAIIKGVPGTRKTTQGATFPDPIFWLDADEKVGQTLALPRKLGFIKPNIDVEYEQPRNWYAIEKKLENLVSRCDFRTVIIDSLTSVGDKINRQTLSKDKGGKKIGGIAVNTIEDFNAETSALMYLVDLVKQINAHVIIIGHVIHRDVISDGVSKAVRQLVTGGKVVGAKLPAYIPEIYHFEFDHDMDITLPPKYVCYTQMHGQDFARTGYPLPYKLDLTNRSLYDLITKAQSELKLQTPEQLNASKLTEGW